MVNCAVFSCKRRSATSNLREHGVSYHVFPKNIEIREQWTKCCTQNKSWRPSRTSVICSDHFTSDCFQAQNYRRKLLDGAIPTLKLCHCTHDETKNEKPITSRSTQKIKKTQLQKESLPTRNMRTLLQGKNKKIHRLQEKNKLLKKKVHSLKKLLKILHNKYITNNEEKLCGCEKIFVTDK